MVTRPPFFLFVGRPVLSCFLEIEPCLFFSSPLVGFSVCGVINRHCEDAIAFDMFHTRKIL